MVLVGRGQLGDWTQGVALTLTLWGQQQERVFSGMLPELYVSGGPCRQASSRRGHPTGAGQWVLRDGWVPSQFLCACTDLLMPMLTSSCVCRFFALVLAFLV